MLDERDTRLTLANLPAELIHHILSYLSPYDIVNISATSHKFRNHSKNDRLWQGFIQQNVSVPVAAPGPCASFQQLYTHHHPRWFLTKYKVWFSDYMYSGKLLVAVYDARRGCIEAYTLVAERGRYTHQTLDWDGLAEYYTFDPNIHLDLDIPIIHLDPTQDLRISKFRNEIAMDHNRDSSTASTFTHTRFLPEYLADSNTAAWPPLTIPSPGNKRTRNESHSMFHSQGHLPTKLSESSDTTFRIRQWMEFQPLLPLHVGGGFSRRGEVVRTYGTIREECYTPTKEKPWQGIWCGDYSGHGCEFLLIMQTDDSEPLSEKAQRAFAMWPRTDVYPYGTFPFMQNFPTAEHVEGDGDDGIAEESAAAASSRQSSRKRTKESQLKDAAPYKGRLIAIKLTGDPNIPRGEITFIAEDLGSRGLVGFAQEPIFNEDRYQSAIHLTQASGAGAATDESSATRPTFQSTGSASTLTADSSPDLTPSSSSDSIVDGYPFDARGARIVKSIGHIANRGFREDEYIPSQLVMVSENTLAQYWRCFGSVSFYKRVNIDQLLRF